MLCSAQPCPTRQLHRLSPPGSSAHGQARLLGWVAISFSRRSFWPRVQIHISCVSCITGEFFTTVPPGKPQISGVHSGHKWWQTHLSSCNLIKTLHKNGLYGAGSNYLYNFEQLIFPQERRQVKLHICPHLETLCMFSSIEKTDVHTSRDSFSSGRGLASVFRYLIT